MPTAAIAQTTAPAAIHAAPFQAAHLHDAHLQPAESRMLSQLEHCLHRGCIIAIEHAEQVRSRYTAWQPWEPPSCYDGDMAAVHGAIARCRQAHCDHQIRLSVEDLSYRSRLALMVHRPH